eukprot:TRINITY_DN15435_c1_g1_i1.p1 TRINITY_DN15435_c1_g1~~TRINITY_DN15435_c1_g1_i1.p1  ORF type:complete len:1789 (+),score=436.94 TRINITY_DN15435_c1_g1_i1:132-5498(+)
MNVTPELPVVEPFPGHELVPLPDGQTSLVEKLVERLQHFYRGEAVEEEDDDLCSAVYDTNRHLRRIHPDEIETVLATFDHKALDQIQTRFGSRAMNLVSFAEAIVHSGTYDPNRVPAFIGGVVDLFFEVQRSQQERAEGLPPGTVGWGQVMNHLIESPEIGMFEGQNAVSLDSRSRGSSGSTMQLNRSTLIDCAKHAGMIEKAYWLPYLGDLVTVEGSESMYFWTSARSIDAPRSEITPQLPSEYFDETGKALFTVLALAWDAEMQDIVGLLSNRMVIAWRLRSREKGQFQQKRVMRIHASKILLPLSTLGQSTREFSWELDLRVVDTKAESSKPEVKIGDKAKANYDAEERQMMREKRVARQAAEIATMLDIWYLAYLKLFATTDRHGRLFFWDLRKVESSMLDSSFPPVHELTAHTRAVTGICEISKYKFTTISLDRTVVLWDTRNLTGPELKIEEHCSAVLAQVYLPLFSSLVSVGCEKKVFVWSIDSTAYRGVRAKLSAHQNNLRDVSAGQRVFFTLDEGFIVIVWDGATLVNLQTLNCFNLQPKSALVMPSMGRLCLIGRRLNFFEGSEALATSMGMALTKEQTARRKAEAEAQGSLKERAKPRWCGMSSIRGSILSATEVEVKIHSRISPAQARVVFNAPEGESITSFTAMDESSLAVLGTSKGGIHFLKYRSGFNVKTYPGRKVEDANVRPAPRQGDAAADGGGSGGAGGGGGGGAGGGAGTQRPRTRSESSGAQNDAAARHRSRSGGAQPRSGASSPGANAMGEGLAGRPRSRGDGGASPQFPATPSSALLAGRSRPTSSADEIGIAEAPGAPGAAAGDEEGGEAREREQRRETARSEVNAPSPEDIARGLTSQVTCVLPCQAVEKIFVGTLEGQVISVSSDYASDFPVTRWTTPEDPSEITCLHCMPPDPRVEDDPGLIVAGTKEGSVQLYSMEHMKPAGAVNIPRILSDADGPHGVPLAYVRLFAPSSPEERTLTMLTSDIRSRMRLWGLRIHTYSGKLSELRLLLNGGTMLPLRLDLLSGAALGVAAPGEREKELDRRKLEAEKEAAAKAALRAQQMAAAAAKGKLALQAEEEKARKEPAKPSVLDLAPAHSDDSGITAFCVVEKQMALPTFERMRWTEEMIKRYETLKALAQIRAEEEAAEAEAAGTTGGKEVFLTDAASSPKGRGGPLASLTSGIGTELKEVGDESDGEDHDEDEVVSERLNLRPRTPPLPFEGEEDKAPFVNTHGGNYLFNADGGGWIRCIDISGSVASALEMHSPMPVHIDDPSVAFSRGGTYVAPPRSQMPRATIVDSAVRARASGFAAAAANSSQPAPNPVAWRVVGAWRASTHAVLSMVACYNPATLVTADAVKDVKVWSTTGDLWAHFSLVMHEGEHLPATLWPPPQTLSAQMALMEIGKSLTDKLGLHHSRPKDKQLRGMHSALPERAGLASSRSGLRSGAGGGPQVPQTPGGGSYRQPATPATPSTVVATPSCAMAQTPQTPAAVPLLPGSAADGGAPVSRLAPAGEDDAAEEAAAATAKEDGVSSAGGEEGAEEGEGATLTPAGAGEEKGKKSRSLTREQMAEMIRTHAFSAGFKSYRQFEASHASLRRSASSGNVQGAGAKGGHGGGHGAGGHGGRHGLRSGSSAPEMEARREFKARRPSAFGLDIATNKEQENWQVSTRSLGSRSTSDGALVRFAELAVADATERVRRELGVDVSTTNRRQIRKPSFLARLDTYGVSADPSHPLSATAQAVQNITGVSLRSDEGSGGIDGGNGRKRESSLQSAGRMAVGRRSLN